MHVLTRKGEGYPPAETDDEKRLHDIGAFDPETGVPAGGQRVVVHRRVPPTRSSRSAPSAPRSSRITAGMPGSTGLLPFAERFPDRCFDVGIAEQHAVTAAAGMAMRGLRPVVAIYSTFLSRAWDQIVYDVGLHGLPVVFCVDRAGITGDDGPSHHGLYDLALLTKVPGLTLFAPSSYEEMAVMLEEALRISRVRSRCAGRRRAARHVMPGAGRRRPRRRARCASATTSASSRSGRWSRRPRKPPSCSTRATCTPTVWDIRTDPARPEDARRRARATASWSPRRTASPTAASAPRSRPRSARWRRDQRPPPDVTLGTPSRTSRTASPPTLLANLGLDGPGIAATVAQGARRRRLSTNDGVRHLTYNDGC